MVVIPQDNALIHCLWLLCVRLDIGVNGIDLQLEIEFSHPPTVVCCFSRNGFPMIARDNDVFPDPVSPSNSTL